MGGAADFVFRGGPVFCADPPRSIASAVAVVDDRIAAVGDDRAVAGLIGPTTEVVELGGRMVTPGFQDAHVHPLTGGRTLLRCNLMDAADLDAAAEIITRYAAEHPEEAWIVGGGWKFPWFPGGMAPRELLDRLVPDRPAYLRVADGHAGWANSAAFDAAGIDTRTPDPPDGRIERLADGRLQGTLQEGAMTLIERAVPADGPAEIDRALLAGQQHLLSLGVTAWQDADVDGDLHAAYLRIAEDGRLVATVRGALWWERDGDPVDQLATMQARRGESVGRYRAGSVKLMLDGVVENFTAAMLEPYLDGGGHPTDGSGLDFLDPEALPEIVAAVLAAGFQPHFHAIGDRAVRSALDAIAAVGPGAAALRPHISHLQVVHPDDVLRFRRLGVAANAQPLWACNDSAMAELTVPFLGEQRAGWQYPFGSLLRSGALLAMGSDWSVSTPNVMAQIDVAVHRQDLSDRRVPPLTPGERISVADALMAFTAGSAYINHLDDDRGTIRPGAIADLVVLGDDPFEAAVTAAIPVDLTMVGGDIVHIRG